MAYALMDNKNDKKCSKLKWIKQWAAGELFHGHVLNILWRLYIFITHKSVDHEKIVRVDLFLKITKKTASKQGFHKPFNL